MNNMREPKETGTQKRYALEAEHTTQVTHLKSIIERVPIKRE